MVRINNWVRCIFLVFILVLGVWACKKTLPGSPAENELLDGMAPGLTSEEKVRFLRGDEAFNNEVFNSSTGLGPGFIASSCAGCHAGDGKGHPFFTLTRFGQGDTFGNPWIGKGGPQLQHRVVPGFTPEVLPAGVPFMHLVAPANSGLGFLEAVSDATLLGFADPNDANGDGISGRVHWVQVPWYVQPPPDAIHSAGKYIGRFGKKAAVFDLLQQTAGAYNQDMGVVSAFEPVDPLTLETQEPEITQARINDVVFYLRTLKVPAPRNADQPNFIAGKALFVQIGCGKCHIPEMQTGNSKIAALRHQWIYPYTDLLLHDMGNELRENYTEGTALNTEWRTPPLWGLGLSLNAQGGAWHLLHDGRAKSIEEAIQYHGGEGSASRNAYRQLSGEERNKLLYFLENL